MTDLATSPLAALRQTMVDNYQMLEAQNSQLGSQLADAHVAIEGLIRENGVLREELDKRTQELQRCQRYAVRLTTRLEGLTDMLKGIADQADATVDRINSISQESVQAMDEKSKEPHPPAAMPIQEPPRSAEEDMPIQEPPRSAEWAPPPASRMPTGVLEAPGMMKFTPIPVQEPPRSAEKPVGKPATDPPAPVAHTAATRLAASLAFLDRAVRDTLSPPPPGPIPVATVPLPSSA